MYMTFIPFVAFFILRTLACNPGIPGCDHPGNFTGALTPFPHPATAHCGPGNQTAFFANVPAAFYNPPDESPCDAPINITHPTTKKTITAMVIGECKPCKGHNIELTHAALMALSPNGEINRAPSRVKWNFVTAASAGEEYK